jgi:hypothetical protein
MGVMGLSIFSPHSGQLMPIFPRPFIAYLFSRCAGSKEVKKQEGWRFEDLNTPNPLPLPFFPTQE